MLNLLKTAILLLGAMILVDSALAKSIPKFIKKSGTYEPVRGLLAKAGWKPIGTQLREEGSCDLTIDERCKTFPEARKCSGTGMAFCNMVWKHKDGTIIVITTGGEGEAVIISAKKQ